MVIVLNKKLLQKNQGRFFLNKKIPFYHLIWNHYNPDNPVKKGMIIHHKDENPANDHISNLQLLTRSEHNRIHKTGKHFEQLSDKQTNMLKLLHEGNKGNKYNLGRKASEETKKKMSEIKKGINIVQVFQIEKVKRIVNM